MTEAAAVAPNPAIDGRARTWFTPESAKAASEASIRARQARKLRFAGGQQPTQPMPSGQSAVTVTGGQADPSFTASCLQAVREQLERVYAMLAKERDPGKIDKLCSASSKLEEQERRLSDRSLPPVRRAQDQAPAKLGHGSSLFAAGLDEV